MSNKDKINYCGKKGYCTAEQTGEKCKFYLRSKTRSCAYLAWEGSCLSDVARASAMINTEVAA